MKKFLAKLQNDAPALWLRALSAFALAAGICRFLVGAPVTEAKYYANMHIIVPAALFLFGFFLMSALTRIRGCQNADRVFLPVCLALFTFPAACDADGMWTVFGLGALWAVLCFYYARQGWLTLSFAPGKRGAIVAVAAAAAVFAVFSGMQGVLRYYNFHSPNFDFGIFANMFYHMRETGVPLTTCERDMPLSHFAVHISPAVYLLWPVYAVFPHPVTLQIMQTLILGSAAVPAYLLARQFSHSRTVASVFAFLAVLHPAVGNGANYDFHENCFLLPLLLWAFWFAERRQYVPFAVFCALTLAVKEDAAVYVIFLALFLLVGRRRYIAGIATGAAAAVWFLIALGLLTKYGSGVMTGRYGNYIFNDGGLMEAIKTVLADPAYVFTQLFVDKQGPSLDKVTYAVTMLLPLGFLPLYIKKPSRILLLLPMLLVNMMTVYPYQFQVGYQYSFGSAAFLMYLAVMNAADLPERKTLKAMLATALCISALCFAATTGATAVGLAAENARNREKFATMEAALSEIPEEAKVACSTSLLPHLANRDVIYEGYYHKAAPGERLDYVLVDRTHGHDEELEKFTALGYKVTKEITLDGTVLILILE